MKDTLLKFVPGKGAYGKHSIASEARYVVRLIGKPVQSHWGLQAAAIVVACNAAYAGQVNDKTTVILDAFEEISF